MNLPTCDFFFVRSWKLLNVVTCVSLHTKTFDNIQAHNFVCHDVTEVLKSTRTLSFFCSYFPFSLPKKDTEQNYGRKKETNMYKIRVWIPYDTWWHSTFCYKTSIKKFRSKIGHKTSIRLRVHDRNFWRIDNFGLNISTSQKLRSGTLWSRFFGVFSVPNFDQNFWLETCDEKGKKLR